MPALQLVWFKRDLRVVDHRPLLEASKRGVVLPLYVAEQELWRQPDVSDRQWQFCREALLDLRDGLAALRRAVRIAVRKVDQPRPGQRRR